MYDVNAEKKPVSAFRATRSITCDGVCRGMGDSGKVGKLRGENGVISEFVNKLSHTRII
jgi:hypothetical protein